MAPYRGPRLQTYRPLHVFAESLLLWEPFRALIDCFQREWVSYVRSSDVDSTLPEWVRLLAVESFLRWPQCGVFEFRYGSCRWMICELSYITFSCPGG